MMNTSWVEREMPISSALNRRDCADRSDWIPLCWMTKSPPRTLGLLLLAVSLGVAAVAQDGPLVLERDGRTIAMEPYAPTFCAYPMSNDRAAATAAPGYGFVAKPSAEGWTHERDAEGYDVYRSARMGVRLAPGDLPEDKRPQPMQLDALNLELRQHYFGGGGGGNGPNDGGLAPHNDALRVTAADGKTLLHMRTWSMEPESAEVAAADAGAKGYRVAVHFRLAGR